MFFEMRMASTKTVLSSRLAVSGLLQQGHCFSIPWVPGHRDVRGNKKAKESTKFGSSSSNVGAEPALLLLHCENSVTEGC